MWPPRSPPRARREGSGVRPSPGDRCIPPNPSTGPTLVTWAEIIEQTLENVVFSDALKETRFGEHMELSLPGRPFNLTLHLTEGTLEVRLSAFQHITWKFGDRTRTLISFFLRILCWGRGGRGEVGGHPTKSQKSQHPNSCSQQVVSFDGHTPSSWALPWSEMLER